jgi:Pvc16 N-terminal domain
MSAHLTIASVTAVLKNLLENTVVSRGVTSAVGGDITVTAVSPDRITAGGDEKPQLNLFLYQITPASMLRAPGLSLELYYLITAYGAQDYQAEILLGHAVQTMVEHQHLTGDTIQKTLAALGGGKSTRSAQPTLTALAGSSLGGNVSSLEVRPQFLDADTLGKLWSALQAKYRPSVTYRISGVPLGELSLATSGSSRSAKS